MDARVSSLSAVRPNIAVGSGTSSIANGKEERVSQYVKRLKRAQRLNA